MIVSGNDVYTVGNRKESSTFVATLWKNGEIQELEECADESTALSVAVSGNDVYVTGKNGDVATLWKNGKKQPLETAGRSFTKGVAINGNDIFVLGLENHECVVWKNGKKHMTIQAADKSQNVGVIGIAVTNNAIYVTGDIIHPITNSFMITTGIVWKNGVKTSMGINSKTYLTYSILVVKK